MKRFLVLVWTTFAPILRGSYHNSQVATTLETIRQIVRKEVLGLGSRLLVGFVLSSAIVLSLAQLGESLKRWISRFENALTFEILGSSGVALLASAGFYFLFRDVWIKQQRQQQQYNQKPETSQGNATTQNDSIDIQDIALRFVEGFANSFETRKGSLSDSNAQTQEISNLGESPKSAISPTP